MRRANVMRTAYKVLAYLVAAEVAVQAMVMVWGIAGLGKWVDSGGVLDNAVFEEAIGNGGMPFPEIAGLVVHGINGTFVVPAIALLLLIVSFFTKVRGTITWAAIVFALVVAQGQIGFLGHEFPLAGALHRLQQLTSRNKRVRRRRCDERPFPSPNPSWRQDGQPAAAEGRATGLGNRRHRRPFGVALADQPGAGHVLRDGDGLPRLRRRCGVSSGRRWARRPSGGSCAWPRRGSAAAGHRHRR